MERPTVRVIREHVSEFPRPITFEAGAPLTVGEAYTGPEGWDDWFFCRTPGQEGGWVPARVIEFLEGGRARAREAYTARELDVRPGDTVFPGRTLNGWAWCEKAGTGESGWVPVSHLDALR